MAHEDFDLIDHLDRSSSANHRVLTKEELVNDAELIVQGTLTAMARGRSVDLGDPGDYTVPTLRINVDVIDTLKGQHQGRRSRRTAARRLR